MLLQTNSYIVPREKREEHARLVRKFRQVLLRLGCESFDVYEQVGTNWGPGEATGRYVQIMRFHDRKHQQAVQAAEKTDKGAQHVIREFCELINFPYQQQHGLFASGFYQSVLPVGGSGHGITERPRSRGPVNPAPPVVVPGVASVQPGGSAQAPLPAKPVMPVEPEPPAQEDVIEAQEASPESDDALEDLLRSSAPSTELMPDLGPDLSDGTEEETVEGETVEGETVDQELGGAGDTGLSAFDAIDDDGEEPDVVEGEETGDDDRDRR